MEYYSPIKGKNGTHGTTERNPGDSAQWHVGFGWAFRIEVTDPTEGHHFLAFFAPGV